MGTQGRRPLWAEELKNRNNLANLPTQMIQPQNPYSFDVMGMPQQMNKGLYSSDFLNPASQDTLNIPQAPLNTPQPAVAPQQQSFDQYYDEYYNPMHQYLQRAYDTGNDEKRAQREGQLAKVLAITNAMRPIADIYFNSGGREAPVSQHQDIGVAKAIDEYKKMLDKIDGKKQSFEMGVLQNKIRALDLFQRVQENDKARAMQQQGIDLQKETLDWQKDKYGEEAERWEKTFEENKRQFGETKALQMAQLASVDAARRQANETARQRNRFWATVQAAKANNGTGKDDRKFYQVNIGGKDYSMSKGQFYDVISRMSQDESTYGLPGMDELLGQGYLDNDEGMKILVSNGWKNYYDVYNGEMMPKEDAYFSRMSDGILSHKDYTPEQKLAGLSALLINNKLAQDQASANSIAKQMIDDWQKSQSNPKKPITNENGIQY